MHIRIFAIAAAVLTAACIPAGTLPGSLEVTKSKFDDRQYVRAEPGWLKAIGPQGVGTLLTGPTFKIGALIHSERGVSLVARVEKISRITGLEVNVNGQVHNLRKQGRTDFTTSADRTFHSTHSRAHFAASLELLRQMTAGTGKVFVRVTTGDGYVEGDFGAGCDSQFSQMGCVAIRNALEKA